MATMGSTSVSDCPICCESYRNPKMISCGHSFCLHPCLRNLMQSSRPNCPLCRITIQLPPSGKVEDLPTNFALLSMVEVHTAKYVSSVDQKKNKPSLLQQKRCDTHEEDFVFYCTVCSELLCQKCLHESHDKNHDTLQVQEAVDKYCGMLVTVEQDLMTLKTKSKDTYNCLKDAKQRCKTQCETVKAKIDEVADSVVWQVWKRRAELHCEVDRNKNTLFNQLEDLEAKREELSLYSDSTIGMCEKLKAELIHRDFKRKRAVDSISKKTTTFLKDMSDLEQKAGMDLETITFKASQPLTYIKLGELIGCRQSEELRLSLSKIKDLSLKVPKGYDYLGFTLLHGDALVYFSQYMSSGGRLRIDFITGQSDQFLGDVDVFGMVSNISTYRMNKSTKLLIVRNGQIVAGVSLFDSRSNIRVIGSNTLSNSLLYHISAVTWDERGENCYALLSDGVTIKMLSFFPQKKETFYVKLENKVECSNSRGFLVSPFGMVICDEKNNEVRFYESTKSARTACVIPAPSRVEYGRPVCVVCQKNDRKWYVLWSHFMNGRTSSLIIQYSASFKEECALLNVPHQKLYSFCFLEKQYMATEMRPSMNTANVSVYDIERNSNPPIE